MPAALPGSTLAQNLANPSAGPMVLFDLLSGPKGSPKDRDVDIAYLASPGSAGTASGNASTGGLSTGIGFGSPPIIGLTAPQSIKDAGFNDDYTLGVTKPDGTASSNSTLIYIGGGRSAANGDPLPYTAGFGIGAAGNGGARDAGAGPAFTGFLLKMVTAAAGVANGAAVETGWANRSGVALTTGQSVFGSGTTASAAPSMVEGLDMPTEAPPAPPPEPGATVQFVTEPAVQATVKPARTLKAK